MILDEQKSIIHNIRKKAREILAGTRNVDRLMTEKVEDYILVEEIPLSIIIGNRQLFIGNLTMENNYKFWSIYGKILANIGSKFINFDMLNDGVSLYKALMMHKRLYKDLCKLIKKTLLKQQAYYLDQYGDRKLLKWKSMNYRYFKKHVTMEKLLQIMKMIYTYNFDGEKKNFQILMGDMAKGKGTKQLMETYIYSWLTNLNGLTGTFQHALLTNVDYWLDDSMKEEIPLMQDFNSQKLPKQEVK